MDDNINDEQIDDLTYPSTNNTKNTTTEILLDFQYDFKQLQIYASYTTFA